MLDQSDEFDLDVQLFPAPDSKPTPLWAPGFANDGDGGLQAERPDTLGVDCVTHVHECDTSDTSCGFTCGCNTSETCTHQCANPDAITFGYDCEDASGGDDTCMCGPGGGGGGGGGDDDGDGDDNR